MPRSKLLVFPRQQRGVAARRGRESAIRRIARAIASLLDVGRITAPGPRPPRQRPLTAQEKALAATVFGKALDLRRVTVRGRKWWLFQPRGTVMAPNGHIYFHPGSPLYRDDFGIAPLGLQALFIHELTHVWQYQSGRNVVLARGPFARYRYLPLTPGKPFERYGIEQQAEIVRDAFRLSRGEPVPGAPPLKVYRALLPFGPEKPQRLVV